jgi:hypothetical protein
MNETLPASQTLDEAWLFSFLLSDEVVQRRLPRRQ